MLSSHTSNVCTLSVNNRCGSVIAIGSLRYTIDILNNYYKEFARSLVAVKALLGTTLTIIDEMSSAQCAT